MIKPVSIEKSSFDSMVLSTTMQKIDAYLQDNIEEEFSLESYEMEELSRNHRILWNVLQSISSLSKSDNVESSILACDRHIEDLDRMLEVEQDNHVIESIKKNRQSWERLKAYVSAIDSLFDR